MVEPKKTLLISGPDGRFGASFITEYKSRYNFICISRRRREESTPGIVTLHCDFNSEDFGSYLFEKFQNLPHVDYVINSAADTTFHAERSEILCRFVEIRNQYVVNVLSPAIVIAALFEAQLKDRPFARSQTSILNMSSESAYSIFSKTRQSFYASTKSALNSLTMHLADEYKPFNIRVNALAPGNFESDERCNQVVKAAHDILQSDANGRIFRMPFQ